MIRYLVSIAGALCVAGCSTTAGRLPAIATVAPEHFKMIRPDANAIACRTRWLGERDSTDAALADALAQLKAVDPEVETLHDARVAVRTWDLGLVRQDCVEVEADLVRSVPVLVLDQLPHTY